MPRTLEERRRAIAEALRTIMTEPAPLRVVEGTRSLNLPLAPLRSTMTHEPLASRARVRTSHGMVPAVYPSEPSPVPLPVEPAASAPHEDSHEVVTPPRAVEPRASVPPLENLGSMSRAASRALFGD